MSILSDLRKWQWLAKAKSSREDLVAFLTAYHPKSSGLNPEPLRVTAHAAEVMRRMGKELYCKDVADPVAAFSAALESGDYEAIIQLLDEAWWTVPESTECWKIRGFGLAVYLIDNPPDEEGEE